MKIENRIKQGCNGSTLLFLLVTYEIIRRLEEMNIGFKNEKFTIPILYYADDGLLLSQTIEEAKENIKLIQEIAKEYGLNIHKEKSSILIFNDKQQPESIENLKVSTSMTYLGIKITNKKRCFTDFRKTIKG